MQELVHKHQLFEPFIFDVTRPNIVTVDDLCIVNPPISGPKPSELFEAEVKERFHLWEECMAIDTFAAMSSSEPFQLDETIYPDEFANPVLKFMGKETVFQVPLDYARLCVPQLARNTLWRETNFASTFDDVREMTCLAALHYSSGLVKYRLSLVRKVRRAMRYSRELAKGAVHRFVTDDFVTIHNALLKQFESIPPIFLPFKSLIQFRPLSSTNSLVINNVWRSFCSFNHDLMFLFAGFAYLHLPLMASHSKQFLLSSEQPEAFSSAAVLVSILKAIGFIVRSLYTPIIGPEIHVQSPLVMEDLNNSMLAPTIPAPGLATVESAVAMYIISSSCLAMLRSNPQYSEEVLELVKKCTVPAIQRIGHVKPMANKYSQKLASMLDMQ
jgi:hypothetical protein